MGENESADFVEGGLTLGFLCLERPGELDAEAECAECGMPLAGPVWLRVVAADGGAVLLGPICGVCATSE